MSGREKGEMRGRFFLEWSGYLFLFNYFSRCSYSLCSCSSSISYVHRVTGNVEMYSWLAYDVE